MPHLHRGMTTNLCRAILAHRSTRLCQPPSSPDRFPSDLLLQCHANRGTPLEAQSTNARKASQHGRARLLFQLSPKLRPIGVVLRQSSSSRSHSRSQSISIYHFLSVDVLRGCTPAFQVAIRSIVIYNKPYPGAMSTDPRPL